MQEAIQDKIRDQEGQHRPILLDNKYFHRKDSQFLFLIRCMIIIIIQSGGNSFGVHDSRLQGDDTNL